MPYLRHRPANFIPASAYFRMPIICSSVNRVFMPTPPGQALHYCRTILGSHIINHWLPILLIDWRHMQCQQMAQRIDVQIDFRFLDPLGATLPNANDIFRRRMRHPTARHYRIGHRFPVSSHAQHYPQIIRNRVEVSCLTCAASANRACATTPIRVTSCAG